MRAQLEISRKLPLKGQEELNLFFRFLSCLSSILFDSFWQSQRLQLFSREDEKAVSDSQGPIVQKFLTFMFNTPLLWMERFLNFV